MVPGGRAHAHHLCKLLALQHQRAHNDTTAITSTFAQIIDATTDNGDRLALKVHCLDAGLYARHIRRWLQYFDKKQVRADYSSIVKCRMILADTFARRRNPNSQTDVADGQRAAIHRREHNHRLFTIVTLRQTQRLLLSV
jgi:hypothetical protein